MRTAEERESFIQTFRISITWSKTKCLSIGAAETRRANLAGTTRSLKARHSSKPLSEQSNGGNANITENLRQEKMSEPIKPAMPEEEWAAQLVRTPAERHEVLMHAKNEADAEGWLTIHGLAALALYNKPYGFTREDVQLLHNSIASMGRHNELGNLADRIEALLPPEKK